MEIAIDVVRAAAFVLTFVAMHFTFNREWKKAAFIWNLTCALLWFVLALVSMP